MTIDYLIQFDDEGNRGATYRKGIHYDSENDAFAKEKLKEGYVFVSDADYMNLLGNNTDSQVYIRKADGTFEPKPPHVPTEEEKIQQEAATTKASLLSKKDSFVFAMLKGENTASLIEDYAVSLASVSDAVAEKIPDVFPSWDSNAKAYKKSDRVEYNGVLYKVLQDHTSQASWTPTDAPSLFAKVLTSTDGTPKEWEQPDSTNPYMKGDRVIFEGKIYESTIDNNVWSPTAHPQGWKEITDTDS